jgi:uncharacterized membrane protein
MSLHPSVGKTQHPALLEHSAKRAAHIQNRIADGITKFAGSMWFVYLSAIWFALWIGFRVEKYPFGLLTMIVSLEAIFLSTFVMISQNRADEKRQALADNQWKIVQTEESQNEELIQLSKKILELTTAIHSMALTLAAVQGQVVTDPAGATGSQTGVEGGAKATDELGETGGIDH